MNVNVPVLNFKIMFLIVINILLRNAPFLHEHLYALNYFFFQPVLHNWYKKGHVIYHVGWCM